MKQTNIHKKSITPLKLVVPYHQGKWLGDTVHVISPIITDLTMHSSPIHTKNALSISITQLPNLVIN